ncbi:hypothetical protein EsDP_00006362 [Epichloe bromicola]|uniref:Uncharacterized protein n=1 Tax=Epichloe bromicola TaxID=79588 RepID=A0ABQ0CXF2_9HYPO
MGRRLPRAHARDALRSGPVRPGFQLTGLALLGSSIYVRQNRNGNLGGDDATNFTGVAIACCMALIADMLLTVFMFHPSRFSVIAHAYDVATFMYASLAAVQISMTAMDQMWQKAVLALALLVVNRQLSPDCDGVGVERLASFALLPVLFIKRRKMEEKESPVEEKISVYA